MSKKITELSALSAAASDDNLPIVDTSTSSTKKITAGNLLASIPDGTIVEDMIGDGEVTPAKISLPCKFSVHRSSSQTVSATTWTLVQLNADVFDTGSDFDLSTNYEFTAPVDGFYQFNGCVQANSVADGGTVGIGINVGAFSSAPTYLGGQCRSRNTGATFVTISKLLKLSAGDKVQMYGYTAGTTFAADNTFLDGFLIAES